MDCAPLSVTLRKESTLAPKCRCFMVCCAYLYMTSLKSLGWLVECCLSLLFGLYTCYFAVENLKLFNKEKKAVQHFLRVKMDVHVATYWSKSTRASIWNTQPGLQPGHSPNTFHPLKLNHGDEASSSPWLRPEGQSETCWRHGLAVAQAEAAIYYHVWTCFDVLL